MLSLQATETICGFLFKRLYRPVGKNDDFAFTRLIPYRTVANRCQLDLAVHDPHHCERSSWVGFAVHAGRAPRGYAGL